MNKERVIETEWDKKWLEVGAMWKNEKSMSLKMTHDISKGENLLVTSNKSENDKAPAYRVWKKRN